MTCIPRLRNQSCDWSSAGVGSVIRSEIEMFLEKLTPSTTNKFCKHDLHFGVPLTASFYNPTLIMMVPFESLSRAEQN
jgi:hypothetical protein